MKKLVFVLMAAFAFMACEKEVEEPVFEEKSGNKMLDLSFEGLSPLGPDYRYEGWLIVDGTAVSTGKFNITPSGQMSPRVFNVKKDVVDNAVMFVLSIEPQPDNDPAPSDTKILGGVFTNGMAELSIAHPAALGSDFSEAMGKYILATPTNGPGTNENSGIWFLSLESGSPMEGLTLPSLPDGWIYEGWTVINGVPVTSGKFMQTTGVADLFDGFSSQENPGPPFPGEDYLMNAPSGLSFPTDLAGGIAVISVEPYPDNGPEPFALKPLAGMIPEDAMDHFTYMMELNQASFPTGMAKK
ncbi:hypothetical protein [uncultured Draconibacterium sp.]|uniref:hypothetical protein n=1 Tax=uncultured Draconibacterium sp. TaxID=1573823 RepID=UPI003260BEC8